MMCLEWTKSGYKFVEPINFDLERMKDSLDSGVIRLPAGQTHDERIAYIKAKLAELDK